MTRWSGMGAAVNAHLRRWNELDQEVERMDHILSGRKPMPQLAPKERGLRVGGDERAVVPGRLYPHLTTWATFAQSWGVPDGEGVLQTPVIVEGNTINGREQFSPGEFAGGLGSLLADREHTMMTKATSIYVSGKVMQRITPAALAMEPEPLFDTDIFTPYGFAVFEEPLLVPDLHPETGESTDWLRVGVRAIGWKPEIVGKVADSGMESDSRAPGVMLFVYTTRDDWNDTYRRDLNVALRTGKLTIAQALHGVTDEVAAQYTVQQVIDEIQPPRFYQGQARDFLMPSDVCPWRFNTPWTIGPVSMANQGVIDSTVAYVRRWFLTLMRFTWQRILVPEHDPLPRKQHKAWTLMNKPPEHEYTVLRLRRPVDRGPKGEGGGHELTYRQLRSGHWKNVHCSTLGPARNPDGSYNPDSHRRQWIEEYWAGPEGAPLGPLHHGASIVR